jgi:hypothetical protein
LRIPVAGDSVDADQDVQLGTSPLIIISRDGEDDNIDAYGIEQLARRYILLEE